MQIAAILDAFAGARSLYGRERVHYDYFGIAYMD